MDADILALHQYLQNPNTQMRVGRKLRRTLYLHLPESDWDGDLVVGIVDTAELAETICSMWNRHFREDFR